LKCPGCGGAVTSADSTCKYCGRPVVISSFNSVYDMSMPEVNKYTNAYKQALAGNPNDATLNNSLAMCYLKLKLYNKALAAFENAMEDNLDNSETYFYAAVCLLEGKKAFLTTRPIINKIEEYINAALMIEPRGVYYYFQAYVKYDYFSRKFFQTSPTYQEALQMANSSGVSQFDIEQFYDVLGVTRPDNL
jgi:tetratricopeptide (TPR) repeat protein